MTAYERDRDDARERRTARDADQRQQIIRARLDDALARREQAIIERWRAHAEPDLGEDE